MNMNKVKTICLIGAYDFNRGYANDWIAECQFNAYMGSKGFIYPAQAGETLLVCNDSSIYGDMELINRLEQADYDQWVEVIKESGYAIEDFAEVRELLKHMDTENIKKFKAMIGGVVC
jgi:predicted class III extradiol MEMO1 family dioxygenase